MGIDDRISIPFGNTYKINLAFEASAWVCPCMTRGWFLFEPVVTYHEAILFTEYLDRIGVSLLGYDEPAECLYA